MRGARALLLGVAVAFAAFALGGCGGGNEAATTTETTTEATTTETTGTETTGTGTKLIGTVGTADDENAFTITLTTEDGAAVSTLAPGPYTLQIKDLATIHNFHLTGPGVDVTSSVGETEDENYDVTLEAGTYNFVCDPHASSMNGSFEVTG